MPSELPELLVADVSSWHKWLADNHSGHAGVFLVLAKKGTLDPTSLRYDEALEVALCHGWIDGRVGRRDEATYRQRFTPRRSRSSWSRRNVEKVARLQQDGRMQPAGLAAVQAAKANGRWERAYAGSATIEVPDDLRAALAEDGRAAATFAELSAQNRYAILYRIGEARRSETRARRIADFVAALAAGKTPHRQSRPSAERRRDA